MSVTVGQAIAATHYNNLQTRISNVLGNGSGNFGYGQTVTSVQVSTGNTVTAAQMDSLRTDMNKVYYHQHGANIPLRNISPGDIIGADVSGDTITYDTLGNYTIADNGGSSDTTGGYNDYDSVMLDLESTDRFLLDPGQDTELDVTTTAKTGPWNGELDAKFTVTWTNADARRHFFNSGGVIRIYGLLTGGNATGKDNDWANMIGNPGVIEFSHNATTVTGSTAGVTLNGSIGNYSNLSAGTDPINSTTKQHGLRTTDGIRLFTKTGNATVYAENFWQVYVLETSTSQLQFTIYLNDVDAGDQQNDPIIEPAIDEHITGTVTLYFGSRRATGSYVSVPQPSFSVSNNL